jgi:hypothetical protein
MRRLRPQCYPSFRLPSKAHKICQLIRRMIAIREDYRYGIF